MERLFWNKIPNAVRLTESIIATIVEGILICLASILLVIPGIILAFAYAMVDYIILDHGLADFSL